MKAYHFAFIGDHKTGKSTFINHVPNINPSYRPPEEIQYLHLISVPHNEGVSDVILWDVPSHTMFHPFLSLSLEYASVIYLCYSIENYNSLSNLKNYFKFIDRSKQFVILLGLKIDLRGQIENLITKNEGFDFYKHNNLDGFIECSTFDDFNYYNVLQLGIEIESRKRYVKMDEIFIKKYIKNVYSGICDFMNTILRRNKVELFEMKK